MRRPARRPTTSTNRSQVSIIVPSATTTTASRNETSSPSWSWRAGGGPMITAGTVRTGRVSSTPVLISPVAARAVATTAPGCPAWTRTLPWTTPPAAAPPGSTFDAALPTTWDTAEAVQDACGSATRTRAQYAAKLASSRTNRTANHQGRTWPRSGQAPIRVIRLGMTT